MKAIKNGWTLVALTAPQLCLLVGLLGAMAVRSASVPLVPAGAVWRFNDTGTDLGTAWREPAYDDSGWTFGPAQFGYGDGDEVTTISYGPDSGNKYPCYYFRHTFAVANPAQYPSLSLEVLRDDGCVVYLNGQEVARYGMPAGTITYNTWASSASDYPWDPSQTIANLLVAGDNVLAVEMHQCNATSTDLSLDLKLTGLSEMTVALNSPAAGATGVLIPATLSATATDPEGQPLTVSFYGRPAPPPAPDFTLIALPDTQYYTAAINGGSPAIFNSQTDWIRNNRDALNIVYVAQLGDLSNSGDAAPAEWINARDALYRLETPILPLWPDGIPYGVAVGNHDQYPKDDPAGTTTSYNQYFGEAHFTGRSYYGGHYGANNDNHYALFTASGLDFIVIYFEYDTAPDQPVLDWANGLLQAHANRRAIVVSHYLINSGNPGSWSAQGLATYNALKGNPNLFLMLCGHLAEGQRADVYEDRTVHTLMADYQGLTAGGNGYLRILQFSPANNQIRVKTYSPWIGQSLTDADSEFTLTYQMTAGPAFALVQQNTGVSSGSQTSAAWTGLQPTTDYEWYASATDGTDSRTSEVRRFTTSANTPPTVTLTSPADGATIPDPGPLTLGASANDSDGYVARVEFFAGTTLLGAGVPTEAGYKLTHHFDLGAYTLTAVAYDNGGGFAVSAPRSITIGGAPTAPDNLAAAAQSSTEILLTWTDSSANESGFEIYQSADGANYTLVATTEANVVSALVAGLQPSTTYSYFVRAFNGAGAQDSAPATATTPALPPPPAAPSGLTATPWSATEIALAWTDNSMDETSFRIERSPDGTSWAALPTVPPGTTALLDAGLTSGTAYYYRVSACNAAGCSAPTAPAAAAPFVDAYATAETIVVGTLSGTYRDTYDDDSVYEQLTEKLSGGKPAVRYSTLEHKWTFTVTPGKTVTLLVQAYQPASSDGDSFVFSYSTDGLAYQDLGPVGATADEGEYQTFDLPGSLRGTVSVRVRDTDRTVGNIALDTLFVDRLLVRTDASPITTAPPPPTLQEATAGNQAVTLRWTPSMGATSYRVWRKSGSDAYAEIASGVTGTSYTDAGVINGVTYQYCVTAVNAYGESAPSNALGATPQAPTVTEPPSALLATSAKRKISLSWTQSVTPGVAQNRIYRSPTGAAGSYVVLATIPATTAYSDSVTSGSTYYYYVTAVSSVGESTPSNVAFGTAK